MSAQSDNSTTPFSRRLALTAGLGISAGLTMGNLPHRAHADGTRHIVLTVTDLEEDPATTIQQVIDELSDRGGGTVQLPSGTFRLAQPIRLRSNITLRGQGPDRTMLREASELGAKPILLMIGTDEERVDGVEIRDLAVRNGEATTTAAPREEMTTELSVLGNEGIVAEYVRGLTMRNILVTEIGGKYGFRCKMTKDVRCVDSRFYRCTYAAFMLLVESENVVVERSEFDTITTAPPVYPNQYLFATGSERRNQGAFLVRDVVVQNCRFLNNPHWQAINTHGGERITFRNNHCENVLVGTIAANVLGFAEHSVLKDITIEGNTYLRGTATDDGIPNNMTTAGICIAGNPLGENIVIRRNTIVGFGGGLFSQGAILSYRAVDILIENNHVADYHQYGLVFFLASFGARVRNNVFDGLAGAVPGLEDITAVIGVPVDGQAHGIELSNNRVLAAPAERRPSRFIWTTGPHMHFALGRNEIHPQGIANPVIYDNVDHFPVDKTDVPVDHLIMRRGERVTNPAGRTVARCLSPREGYGSLDTTTVLAVVDGTVGSSEITIVDTGYAPPVNADFFEPYGLLPPGMNVAIPLEDGELFTAQVESVINSSTIRLDEPLPTSLTRAEVRRRPLAWARPLP